MSQSETKPISETIRGLIDARIRENGGTLADIARSSNVDYRRLHRWFSGGTETLDADLGIPVYETLTGEQLPRA